MLDSCSGQRVHLYRRWEPEPCCGLFEATVDVLEFACSEANEEASVVDGSDGTTAVLRLLVRLLVRKRLDEDAGELLDGERWPLELPGDRDG